jgi:hypothetical protein
MPDGSDHPAPTTLRMRDTGPVSVPFTIDVDFDGEVSVAELKQAIGAFNFQLPNSKLTLHQPVSRLQANGMITMLEMQLPTQADAVADVILRTAVPKWKSDNGLTLKPEIEANLNLLTFAGGQLSIYGTGNVEYSTGSQSMKGELTGGLQIRWRAKASKGQAKKSQ